MHSPSPLSCLSLFIHHNSLVIAKSCLLFPLISYSRGGKSNKSSTTCSQAKGLQCLLFIHIGAIQYCERCICMQASSYSPNTSHANTQYYLVCWNFKGKYSALPIRNIHVLCLSMLPLLPFSESS